MSVSLERQVFILKCWAVLSIALTLGLPLVVELQAQNRRQRITELDVERINVVEPDGRLALVIANKRRMTGPLLEGKELPAEVSGRAGSAGLIFVDAQGNEVGGLTYAGVVRDDGTYRAGASLTFDQHNQDQVVGLQYSDDGSHRTYGLAVWDRPTKFSMKDVFTGITGRVDREAVQARYGQLMKERDETAGGRRVFLGSQDRVAGLRVMDTMGRERIRAVVGTDDIPRIELIDAQGKVVSFP
jgi:hypothetical protein